jgi:hypothetical protein
MGPEITTRERFAYSKPMREARENPLTLTLSPQGRGEGTGQDHPPAGHESPLSSVDTIHNIATIIYVARMTVFVVLCRMRKIVVAHRFSSRVAALNHAQAKQGFEEVEHRPKGARYDTFQAAFAAGEPPTSQWIYPAPRVLEGTAAQLFVREDGWKTSAVIGFFEGGWYRDFPQPPYLLFRLSEWTDANTVYVCQGEG